MLQNLTGWHALIILAIVVLIFGAAKLPALAKSVGQSMRILKSEVAETSSDARADPASGVGDPADARDSADIVRPALRAAE
ncbi:sec-independent protein translocase protein TatA [Microbacterium foliorum]|jgi:sec-independent protein translocase protein TatA|uniref:Sec-independent protein translocase protein TatA n=1 Tax=Microbacterium foliorum TaxID=104336 RepID=A0ABU1HXK5_9MICO|nr:twin-arginine translocase TatA/TatE family subunit [Microbacterium foliorum]MDR6143989.1 sec-independent protein translocase protein TatA [Microbacterium foliorum]